MIPIWLGGYVTISAISFFFLALVQRISNALDDAEDEFGDYAWALFISVLWPVCLPYLMAIWIYKWRVSKHR